MILDNIDNTDQNTKGIHSRAQRGGKNGVPLPGEPRRRPPKNMLSQESQKMCFECSVAINCELMQKFKI